ncbi:hypothetical protein BC829DRAFT_117653 [Chytridium lagenaria]|nr:hypothetical protein BC829DRAFT_117653 [Chytridium lagenaria]
MTHKPLLSFSNSAINYQERDRKSPKVASSKRRVEKEKARTEQLPQPRGRGVAETDRERYDREERDRLQMMDDLWEQEQAQMERLMDEERKRLAGGGAPEPDSAVDNEPRRRRDDGSKSSRERRNRSRAPAEDSRHRSDSARRKRPEDSSIKVSVAAMPSSSRREKERSGPERHVAGREREHDRAVGGDGGSRGGTLGRSKPKPLVDISGVSNCLTCGCSEFRSAHGARADTCTNW